MNANSQKLRILIMSSDLTFVPGNNQMFMQHLLTPNDAFEVVGILLHANWSLFHMIKAISLIISGAAPRVGLVLLRNLFLPDPKVSLARKFHVPLHRSNNPHDLQSLEWSRNLQADLILHMRTRVFLKPSLLSIPRLGCINIHHGLLPAWRGTFCDLRQMVTGHSGGFSIHLMSEAVDQGALLAQYEVCDAKECNWNYERYLTLSENLESQAILRILEQIAETKALPSPSEPLFHVQRQPIRWYRTPNIKELRQWRREGWKL